MSTQISPSLEEVQGPALVSVYEKGSSLTVKRSTYSGARKGGPGGPRGAIRMFSRASRRRLLRRVSQLDGTVRPLFVTLTYPRAFPEDPEEWKRHLNTVWDKRLRRRYPKAGYIWRIEFQRRGAPHFHLILYGITGPLRDFRAWLSLSWYETVASGDDKHLRAGTNAQPTSTARGRMAYMAKELGKTRQASLSDEYPDGIGRWWGVKHKDDLPWSPLAYRKVAGETADRIIRLMRRAAGLRGREYHTLTIFANGEFWSDRLDDIIELFEGEPGIPDRPLSKLVEAESQHIEAGLPHVSIPEP